jgi:hypothetical protein
MDDGCGTRHFREFLRNHAETITGTGHFIGESREERKKIELLEG